MLEFGLALLPLMPWAVAALILATSHRGAAVLNAARSSMLSTAVSLGLVILAVIEGARGNPIVNMPAIDLGGVLTLGWRFDSLSAVMAILVLGVSLVVQKYSLRYLDGDPDQKRFFGWLGFVTASALSFVMSRNVALMVASWWLVSLGVHKLLLHYPDRPGAREAARIKFYVSRLGDAALVTGLVFTWRLFGTFEFDQLAFASVAFGERVLSLGPWHSDVSAVHVISLCFALGAMTKSAQLPFHMWLPKTMETPTPVSALMHAGIINAGGFLIVRLSPVLAHSRATLGLLFVVGAATALYGAAVMLVQNDVKRSLAYSTISQMGFMMMQCGLGAFSAAILHLFMHGLFKAYMFLSSAGEVQSDAHRLAPPRLSPKRVLAGGMLAIVASGLIVFASSQFVGVDWTNKSGGLLLALFLLMTGAQGFFMALSSPKAKGAIASITITFTAGCLCYLGGLKLLESLFARSIPTVVPSLAETKTGLALMILVGLVFFAGMIASWTSAAGWRPRWSERVYVHTLNRFYLDDETKLLTHRSV